MAKQGASETEVAALRRVINKNEVVLFVVGGVVVVGCSCWLGRCLGPGPPPAL